MQAETLDVIDEIVTAGDGGEQLADSDSALFPGLVKFIGHRGFRGICLKMDAKGAAKRLKFIHKRLLNGDFRDDRRISAVARFLLKIPAIDGIAMVRPL
jgi:hypothetical protein